MKYIVNLVNVLQILCIVDRKYCKLDIKSTGRNLSGKYSGLTVLGLFHLKGYGEGDRKKKYIMKEGGSEPKVCKEGVV